MDDSDADDVERLARLPELTGPELDEMTGALTVWLDALEIERAEDWPERVAVTRSLLTAVCEARESIR